MGLISMLEHKSEFEPEPHLIKPYTELFERLDAIMARAEKEGKQTWTIKQCQTIIGDLKQVFYRADLPKRTTIWQIMLVDCCLEPLWDLLHPECDSDETQLLGAVIDARHLIGFWKSVLECQGLAIGLIRSAPASAGPTDSEGALALADVAA